MLGDVEKNSPVLRELTAYRDIANRVSDCSWTPVSELAPFVHLGQLLILDTEIKAQKEKVGKSGEGA